MREIKRIIIVGGGVSGSLVAANVLRLAETPVDLKVIERRPPLGRGVAYGTDCAEHRLNVPAERMGAFPDEPNGFYRWVAERAGRVGFPAAVAPGDFLPRRVYGDYVYDVLANARERAIPEARFESIAGEVVDIDSRSNGCSAILSDGRSYEADAVVLALGNLPGEYPIRRSLSFFHSDAYVHVPWLTDRIEGIARDCEVLIVGAGLTAVDVAVQLVSQGHIGRIHALSRRGLWPQAHRPGLAPTRSPFARGLPATARAALRGLRSAVATAREHGEDWRPVIDAVRGQTQTIWQNWSLSERSRFLRYLRPYWEVHRHRLAPEIAEKLEQMREAGQVYSYSGRLQSVAQCPHGAEAVFRARGSEKLTTLKVAKVINCTGPRSDYTKYQHPLFINLLARGTIDHDPLTLGLLATPEGRVLRYRAEPNEWLWTIGPPMKGVLWECTAVPEIRAQARALATRLLAQGASG